MARTYGAVFWLTSRIKHELINWQGALKSKQSKEGSEQGKVKWDVYMEYAKTSNLSAVAVYLTMLLGAQAAQIGKFPRAIPLHERQRIQWIISVATKHAVLQLRREGASLSNDGTLTPGVCRRKLLAQELGRDQRTLWN